MADLDRFLAAQGPVIDRALAELRAGRKRSHWMWFVFPQLAGLGTSDMARRYALASLDEARAYLDHPLLGARYRACLAILRDLLVADPVALLGPIDAMKLRSSLTLFESTGQEPAVAATLDRWFAGQRDPLTLARLGPA